MDQRRRTTLPPLLQRLRRRPHTTIKPLGERFMADTLSSDGKKVVQGLYDAIAAGGRKVFRRDALSVPG